MNLDDRAERLRKTRGNNRQLSAVQRRMARGEVSPADRAFLVSDVERMARKFITRIMADDGVDYQHAVMAFYGQVREHDGRPPAKPGDMYQAWSMALTEARYEVRGWCHSGWQRCNFCHPGIGRDFPPDHLDDAHDAGYPHYVDPMGVMETEGILPHQILAVEIEAIHNVDHAGAPRGCRRCMSIRASRIVYADGRS